MTYAEIQLVPAQPRSQGPLSSSLEKVKVPWLRLVTCLCIQIKSAPGVGLRLNCVKTVYGDESCFALQTLF